MTDTSEPVPVEGWVGEARNQLQTVQEAVAGLLARLDREPPDRSTVTAALNLLATAHIEIELAAQRNGVRTPGRPLLRLDEHIAALNLNNRPYNVLWTHDVWTIGDLITLAETDLAAMRNMRPADVAEITRALGHHNLALAGDQAGP